MAVRPKTVVTYRTTARATSHARTEIPVRDLVSVIDEPVERGGTNEGITPTETALAALIGCTNVIGHKAAHQLGGDLGTVSIEAACQFDRRGVLMEEEIDLPFPEITLTVTCTGPASQAQLDKVGEDTGRYCAIAKLFQAAGTKLTVNWQKSLTAATREETQ